MPEQAEFDSVLFVPGAVQEDCATAEPAFFRDLNLDMLVVQMCAGHRRANPGADLGCRSRRRR